MFTANMEEPVNLLSLNTCQKMCKVRVQGEDEPCLAQLRVIGRRVISGTYLHLASKRNYKACYEINIQQCDLLRYAWTHLLTHTSCVIQHNSLCVSSLKYLFRCSIYFYDITFMLMLKGWPHT